MLLDAILIVLRETLEAGVLVSVLASIGTRQQLSLRWLWSAFGAGLFGAALIAINLRAISDWFDGVGQEVVDAMLQYAVYLLLLALLIGLRRGADHWLKSCMIATVALTIAREGSEILLFFSTYLRANGELVRALTSGFVGLMIGLSVGILCYFVLTITLPQRIARTAQKIVLPLLAAGMTMQATQLLQQADWLPSTEPIWDSGGLLAEQSLPGQLAYAVFGYEATPTAIEVGVYVGALALIVLALAVSTAWRRAK